MLTTITVNGTEGLSFLASLLEQHARAERPIPPALAARIEHVTAGDPHDLENVRLEVTTPLAEEIAAFVEDLSGGRGQPLLFSAEVGDIVVIVRDVLAEMHGGKRESRIWRFIAGGTRARLVSRKGDVGKLLLLEGPYEREHAYVSDRCTTRSRPRNYPR